MHPHEYLRLMEREQISIMPVQNGWIVELPRQSPEELDEEVPENDEREHVRRRCRHLPPPPPRQLVFRFRDHDAMVDLIAKACRSMSRGGAAKKEAE